METFPGAFMLLGASLYSVTSVLSFYTYTQRGRLLVDSKGREIEPDTQETKL